jgi:AcrR family transcriptional regulator
MPQAQKNSPPSPARRRADAERSITSILDAALELLGSDHDASMAQIARRAGVVRATIYVHFPTRDALLDAVTERTLAEVDAAIRAVEPDQGTPAEALERVIRATWRTLGRYQGIVAINTQRLDPDTLRDQHAAVLGLLEPLIRRGQKDGTFRPDVPADWHLSMLMALIHAASAEARTGRMPDTDTEEALITTVLGAVNAQH